MKQKICNIVYGIVDAIKTVVFWYKEICKFIGGGLGSIIAYIAYCTASLILYVPDKLFDNDMIETVYEITLVYCKKVLKRAATLFLYILPFTLLIDFIMYKLLGGENFSVFSSLTFELFGILTFIASLFFPFSGDD